MKAKELKIEICIPHDILNDKDTLTTQTTNFIIFIPNLLFSYISTIHQTVREKNKNERKSPFPKQKWLSKAKLLVNI